MMSAYVCHWCGDTFDSDPAELHDIDIAPVVTPAPEGAKMSATTYSLMISDGTEVGELGQYAVLVVSGRPNRRTGDDEYQTEWVSSSVSLSIDSEKSEVEQALASAIDEARRLFPVEWERDRSRTPVSYHGWQYATGTVDPTHCLDEDQVQVITCDRCEHEAHPTQPRDLWET